jgi:hypothetical protein
MAQANYDASAGAEVSPDLTVKRPCPWKPLRMTISMACTAMWEGQRIAGPMNMTPLRLRRYAVSGANCAGRGCVAARGKITLAMSARPHVLEAIRTSQVGPTVPGSPASGVN